MNKITKEQLQDYVAEVGEFEKEHRKGGSFYASCFYTFKQDDIETLKDEGINASDFLDVCVTLNGYWSEYEGCEWEDIDFCKVEEYQEFIPEQIIPAHYVTKQKTEAFDYKWE